MKRLLLLMVLVGLAVFTARAQDPVKVDPKHYKVVFENDQVRVLRIHYGVHEKSVMHEHPNAVAVSLTDFRTKFTFPNGKSSERAMKAGQALWTPAEKHLPENVGSTPVDLVLVEQKPKAAAGPTAAGKPAPKK